MMMFVYHKGHKGHEEGLRYEDFKVQGLCLQDERRLPLQDNRR